MPRSASNNGARYRGKSVLSGAGVTKRRMSHDRGGDAGLSLRRCSDTWFDDECIVIAPASKVTDYSVFAERDVTKVKLGALVRTPNKKTPSAFVKDDEEGNVYISNKDL